MTTTELEQISKLLGSDDPRDRARGVRQLQKLRDQGPAERERASQLLPPMGADQEPFIRWNAAVAAGLLGGPGAVELLQSEAEVTDEHANTRLRVALALGLLGDPRRLAILERYAEDPYKIGEHAVVRAFAALALGLLGDPAGVPSLTRLAADDDPAVRWHTAVALGDIGHPDGLKTLITLTEDPIPFVRAHAVIALARLGDQRGLAAVQRVATTDEAPRARHAAGQALQMLNRILGS